MKSQDKPKNILMIDRNYMADRRYVLEAKALREMGCNVLIVCTESIMDPELNMKEVGGLPIMRFSQYENSAIPDVFLTMEKWINWHRHDGRLPAENKTQETPVVYTSFPPPPRRKRWYDKIVRVCSLSNDLRSATEHICASPSRPIVRAATLIAVSLLSTLRNLKRNVPHAYAGRSNCIEPLSDVSDIGIPIDTIPFKGKEDEENLKCYFIENPLDCWEQQVVKFAMTISDLDVVHIHDVTSLRPGLFIAKQLGLPTVFDVHEMFAYQPGVSGKRKATYFDIESRFIHHCTRVVAVNRDQVEMMQRDYNFNDFVFLTNAAERPEGFDINKRYDYFRKSAAIPPDHKILLYTGGTSYGRKIDQLLMGLAQARKDVHVALMMWGPEYPYYRMLVKELKLQDRVHFIDTVPCDEMVFWCASADAGIVPYQALDHNTRICLPNKFYEFIAAGVPVIASTELTNLKTIIEKENFGVVKPFHGPEYYTAAIEEMFDDKLGGSTRFRPSILKNGERYLWEYEAKDFIGMYRDLLGMDQPQNVRKLSA